MTLIQAIILGIVEGLTEFIPVSSTAHLLITQTILNIPANEASFIFNIVVQMGAIIALIVYFWRDLVEIVKTTLANLPNVGKFNSMPMEAKTGWYLVLASVPALAAGYLLKPVVEGFFQQPLLHSSVRLMAAAILLTGAEFFGKQKRDLTSITWLDSLLIGLFQVLAVFPGASRSGSTISGAMYLGFDRKSAARFAMLMSVPVMLAAGLVEMLDLFSIQNGGAFLLPVFVGTMVAGITGWLAIKWLLNYLQNHSLYLFSAYCFVASVACYYFYTLA
jgi:undecaprenyl-diphosphatase